MSGRVHIIVPGFEQLNFSLRTDDLELGGFTFNADDVQLFRLSIPAAPDRFATGARTDLSSESAIGFGFGGFGETENVLWSGRLSFSAAPASLTCRSGADPSCGAHAPFAFAGSLQARDIDTEHPLRDFQLIGRGRVDGTFDATFPGEPVDLSYVFEAGPVPEPGTLILLVAASGAMAVRRRCKRSQWRSRQGNVCLSVASKAR